ncbi:hypothetical protein O181_033613 [Austropuccinia psidii MF-1]|uniref:Integrase catalytic domain-containing protein n=1 Tax=Austropuccinia psidii MF-1 TaxID=1389203 RepID=A0A9Q3H6L7_9BASI|nr:hypothetical protein [Austropuccinia psidii MF-1]
MIQTPEDMISRFCAYVLELKDSDGFTHDWCTLIPALELAYKTTIHDSTGKTPAMLEKGWNPRLPVDNLKKDLVYIHPTSSSFKLLLDKVRNHAKHQLFANGTPLEVPPLDKSVEKKVLKVLKEGRLRGKDERGYLIRYNNPQHEDEWIVPEKIPDSQRFLRIFRHERRPIPQ